MSDVPQLDNERFQLLEPIGDGAVAHVWRAVDRQTGEPVAIKLMRTSGMSLEDVQRLAQEVEILRKLHHPCIVRIYATGVAQAGNPYLALECVDGITLRNKLDDDPTPAQQVVRDIISQICAGLAEAHQQGVIHRDMKPENVLLCAPELVEVKLVDFGMAKVVTPDAASLTIGNKIFGTPQYMAPERAMGSQVTPAVDIYAVAVMAYEMLEGKRPFDGDNPLRILTAHVRDCPPPLERASAAVAAIVERGMAKDPAVRPSAREFGCQLSEALSVTSP